MKRIVVWSLLVSFIVSTITPLGVVFAIEGEVGVEVGSDSEEVVLVTEELLVEEPEVVIDEEEARPLISDVINTTGDSEEGEGVEDIDVPPPTPASFEKILIAKVRAGSSSDEYVVLYNPNDAAVVLAGLNLEFVPQDSSRSPQTLASFTDQQSIESHSFFVITNYHHEVIAGDMVFDVKNSDGRTYTKNVIPQNGSVRLVRDGTTVDLVGWGGAYLFETKPVQSIGSNTVQRCESVAGQMVDSDNNVEDFLIYDLPETDFGIRAVAACPQGPVPDEDPEVPATPLNRCEGLRLSEIGANLSDDEQFIEVENTSDQVVDLLGCRLATHKNKNEFIFGEVELRSGEFMSVKIIETELRLIKTTDDVVFLLDSEGSEIDEVKYQNLKKDTSWSLFDGIWVATYVRTPGETNLYERWLPCEAGYWRNESTGRCNKIAEPLVPTDCGEGRERNPETGRCRNIPTPRQLAPCREGQYRSEETGRCRSIAMLVDSLKPCAEGQFRNPLTNRCKKIASTDDVALADCGEGRERNPETNRCRNILASTMPTAPFAPVQVTEAAQATYGWWALGGVSAAAIGYASWQWRSEAARLIRRAGSVFGSRSK